MLKKKVLFATSISICILAGCQQKVDENGTSILLKNDANSTAQILAEQETDSTTQDSGEEITVDSCYPPTVMIDDILYQDTGYENSMVTCGTMDGEITSCIETNLLPTENNQSNFGKGFSY